ncbi:prepilin-type N-terminal cleavage/methylation domain-containing protein [Nocardioides marmoriginsengisoli]|uniref:Prepilin-type N-terminal cleavage/methylation domain-containing protein n=1 Tax=Nocardioides marmoriginsengisoli TaxID=661483 RepID=A0A3N0CGN7_9ACTN|nr:prepilin-type N-terminal cleavage/methylation domain-containing protein [Nocardioides marmoriginsengisoli]RNL62391.1 prepilin-type N-terminal cleavage/methylation domain-containing protein [Nocardioides marmoriginsengisoli]
MLRSAVNRARAGRRDEAGFTLIELLIVIVILGILAGIVVFSVAGITDKGDKAACKSTIASIDTAYEAAYAQGTATSTAVNVSTLGAFFHGGTAPTTVKNGAGTTVTLTTVAAADAIVC